MTDQINENWYIVKQPSNQCKILSEKELQIVEQAQQTSELATDPNAPLLEKWGPYTAKNQAIAKRIGLIRAGKCEPVQA